jgi:hypothetical protein
VSLTTTATRTTIPSGFNKSFMWPYPPTTRPYVVRQLRKVQSSSAQRNRSTGWHQRGTFNPATGRGAPLTFRVARRLTPTHGYAPTREAAMAAFAKSWRRE